MTSTVRVEYTTYNTIQEVFLEHLHIHAYYLEHWYGYVAWVHYKIEELFKIAFVFRQRAV